MRRFLGRDMAQIELKKTTVQYYPLKQAAKILQIEPEDLLSYAYTTKLKLYTLSQWWTLSLVQIKNGMSYPKPETSVLTDNEYLPLTKGAIESLITDGKVVNPILIKDREYVIKAADIGPDIVITPGLVFVAIEEIELLRDFLSVESTLPHTKEAHNSELANEKNGPTISNPPESDQALPDPIEPNVTGPKVTEVDQVEYIDVKQQRKAAIGELKKKLKSLGSPPEKIPFSQEDLAMFLKNNFDCFKQLQEKSIVKHHIIKNFEAGSFLKGRKTIERTSFEEALKNITK